MRPPRKHLAYIVILGFICQTSVTSDMITWWLQDSQIVVKREGAKGQEETAPTSLPSSPLFLSLHGQCACPLWVWSMIQGHCLESIPYCPVLGTWGRQPVGFPPSSGLSGRRQRAVGDSAPSLYLECF